MSFSHIRVKTAELRGSDSHILRRNFFLTQTPPILPLHGLSDSKEDEVYHAKQSLAEEAGKWGV